MKPVHEVRRENPLKSKQDSVNIEADLRLTLTEHPVAGTNKNSRLGLESVHIP